MQFSDHVKIRKEKFGTVIFDTLTEKIFITNEIGADILAFIEQGKNFPEVVGSLSNVYDADSAAIQKDTTDFVECLRANKFLKSEE